MKTESTGWGAFTCWILFMVTGGILLLLGVKHSIPNAMLGILCGLMIFSAALFIPGWASLRWFRVPREGQGEEMSAEPEL